MPGRFLASNDNPWLGANNIGNTRQKFLLVSFSRMVRGLIGLKPALLMQRKPSPPTIAKAAMRTTRCRLTLRLIPVLLFFLMLPAGLLPAATFSVTPASVSNTYAGNINLVITGLTNGETVSMQWFLDANTNGLIDAPDLMIGCGQFTDI